MGIKVRCQNGACRMKMTVGAAYAGKQLHCPVCGSRFVAGTPDQGTPEQLPALWAPLLGEFVPGPTSKQAVPDQTRSQSGTGKESPALAKAWEALDVESLLAEVGKSHDVSDPKSTPGQGRT
jgi:hypothetical protein